MPIPKAPWRNLAPTPLEFGEWGGVFLQDPEAVLPVIVFEVVPRAVPGPGGPHADGKWEGSLGRALHTTDVKDLCGVLRLTDQKPVPVNFRFRPMHTPTVQRH